VSSALVSVALVLAATPTPERTFELVLSPQFSVEVGARGVTSAQRMAFLYDDALSAAIAFDEGTPATKALAVLARFAKLGLVDVAIANLMLTVQHEVFGHGARAREEGQSPSFLFAVPLPYRFVLDPNARFGGFATVDRTIAFADRDLPFIFGGMESETFMTHLFAVRALSRDGSLHFSESLSYLLGRSSYVTRLVAPEPLGVVADAGDPDRYVLQLMERFNRFGVDAQTSVSQRLRLGWATQFVDPLFWVCAKQLFFDYLWKGERWARLPRFQIQQVGLLPTLRFNMSPFGGNRSGGGLRPSSAGATSAG